MPYLIYMNAHGLVAKVRISDKRDIAVSMP